MEFRVEKGVVTFTTRKPRKGARYSIISPSGARFSRVRGIRRRRPKAIKSRYDDLIRRNARHQQVETALVKAVVHAESSFNPDARSKKGAIGLMQLMPQTAKRFGVRDAYLPEQNVLGGTKYLRLLLDRYKGNEVLAIAAYNAGEGAVDRNKGVPPYRETQHYVKKVIKLREIYRCVERGRRNC